MPTTKGLSHNHVVGGGEGRVSIMEKFHFGDDLVWDDIVLSLNA